MYGATHRATTRRWLILHEVAGERTRQEQLKAEGKFDFTAADAPHLAASAILTEEVGEAAREALALAGIVRETGDVTRLRKELIQVAAVAVAWVEKIDAETRTSRAPGGTSVQREILRELHPGADF
jgi:hypothetical protein